MNFVSAWLYLFLRGGHYRLIHAHCLSPFTVGAILAGRLRGCRSLVKLCSVGTKGDIRKIKRMPGGKLVWHLAAKADVFIAQTEDMAIELQHEGVPRDKIAVVGNAFVTDGYPAVHRRDKTSCRAQLGLPDLTTVLYAGRFDPEKNLGLLMRGWSDIETSHKANLVLVGDGPDKLQIERWRKSLSNPNAVILAGYQEIMDPWYRAADIFVFPSRSEAYGSVLIEAMNHGLATITTRVGVVRDWENIDSILRIIDCDDPQSLIDSLKNLLEEESARTALGKQAKEHVQGLNDIDNVADAYCEIYAKLNEE